MRTVYFPKPITEEHRLTVMKINGLVDPSRGGGDFGNHRGRPKPGPWKQWVEGEQEWEGQTVEGLPTLYFWKDPEAAVNFITKQMEAVMEQTVGEDGNTYWVYGERLLAVDRWERQLREAGAIGWIDEHCGLRHVRCRKWALDRFAVDKSRQSIVISRMTPRKLMEDLRERLKERRTKRPKIR